MKIHDYLKNNYGYSDFQIGQIRYTIISILSDVSKLIIMGIFFILTDYFFQYLAAIATLLVLRTCTGGLHFKHYFSCLALSFFLLYANSQKYCFPVPSTLSCFYYVYSSIICLHQLSLRTVLFQTVFRYEKPNVRLFTSLPSTRLSCTSFRQTSISSLVFG